MVAAPFTPGARNETFELVSREGLRGDADGLVDVDWRVPEAATESRRGVQTTVTRRRWSYRVEKC